MIAVPMWNEFMNYALKDKPIEQFTSPDPALINSNIKNLPPVKGIYCYNDGGINYSYSILPENDSQYILWKIPADNWVQNNVCPFVNINQTTAPIIIN